MTEETFAKFGQEPISAWAKPGERVQVELGTVSHDTVRSVILVTPESARSFAAALLAAADRAEGKS